MKTTLTAMARTLALGGGVTALAGALTALGIYIYSLQAVADGKFAVQQRLPSITLQVADLSAATLSLDDAQHYQLRQALAENPPGISCDDTTHGYHTVERSERAVTCYLQYNVHEPMRYKARARYELRFEDETPSWTSRPRRPLADHGLHWIDPLTIYPYSENYRRAQAR